MVLYVFLDIRLDEVSAELVLFKSYVPNILSVISGSVCRFKFFWFMKMSSAV